MAKGYAIHMVYIPWAVGTVASQSHGARSLQGLGMNCGKLLSGYSGCGAALRYFPILGFCSDDLDNWLITQIEIRSVSAHNYRCFVWDRVCALPDRALCGAGRRYLH